MHPQIVGNGARASAHRCGPISCSGGTIEGGIRSRKEAQKAHTVSRQFLRLLVAIFISSWLACSQTCWSPREDTKISSEFGTYCRPGALTGRLFQRAVRQPLSHLLWHTLVRIGTTMACRARTKSATNGISRQTKDRVVNYCAHTGKDERGYPLSSDGRVAKSGSCLSLARQTGEGAQRAGEAIHRPHRLRERVAGGRVRADATLHCGNTLSASLGEREG